MTVDNPVVFIVEDDIPLAEAFSIALNVAEFSTVLIKNGAEFQAAFEEAGKVPGKDVPALVLMDLHLPDADGEDLIASIRDDERFNGTKVIVVTADNCRAREMGGEADLVLVKPVAFRDLKKLARRYRPQ